ncbi:hypothetical protein [Cytobacillus dafuensis]|uniref:Uncharacterized protein n=1 Tax=Cytobacillus dafuensis TaxID=1742359 RepID=A0A5B8Z573_CYTDA|nr:hypothetical protein [Cytobacillus dafuensis]QED48282.1 hypothetical protein FSZ17_14115 [Cytobacillus dafuensis]
MENIINYEYLIKEYRSLWKNRLLSSDLDAKNSLIDAIRRELKDENAHPRVRKTSIEKYYLATKRIMESNLSEGCKISLIQLHIEQMKDIYISS